MLIKGAFKKFVGVIINSMNSTSQFTSIPNKYSFELPVRAPSIEY